MKIKDLDSKARWIRVGSGRSFRALIRWVEGGKNKEARKKRVLLICGFVAAAVALLVQVSTFAPAVIAVLILGVFAWWGSWPHEEMTMKFSDFQAPIEMNGTIVPGGDVLRKYVKKFPDKDAAQIAEHLSTMPGASYIDEKSVGKALDVEGIRLGVTRREKAAADAYTKALSTPPTKKAADWMKKRLADRTTDDGESSEVSEADAEENRSMRLAPPPIGDPAGGQPESAESSQVSQ